MEVLQLCWLLFRSVASCQCNRKSSAKLRPRIMLSLCGVTEKTRLALSPPPLFCAFLFLLTLIGCHSVQPAVGQGEESDYKAGGCAVCQDELRRKRLRKYLSGLLAVFFPSFLYHFCLPLSNTSSLPLTLLHLLLSYMSAKAMDREHPLTNCRASHPEHHGENSNVCHSCLVL